MANLARRLMGALALGIAGVACSPMDADKAILSASSSSDAVSTHFRVGPQSGPVLNQARFRHTATLLADGSVLIAGGSAEIDLVTGLPRGALDSCELFEPSTDTFERLPTTLHSGRWGHTATPLRDGSVLFVGGFTDSGVPVADAELYLPESREFVSVGALSAPRGLHTATQLADGRVLVVGGSSEPDGSDPVRIAETYLSETGEFSNLSGETPASFPNVATLLEDGQVSLIWPSLEATQMFDPTQGDAGTFSELTRHEYDFGTHVAATRLNDGSVLVVGSQDGSLVASSLPVDSTVLSSVFRVDLPDSDASVAEPFSLTRAGGRICIVASTHLLCLPSSFEPLRGDSLELDNNPLQSSEGIPIGDFHTATALADGSVLHVGGAADGVLDGAQRILWRRALEEKMTPLDPPFPISAGMSATLLPNGQVLVIEGAAAAAENRVALFNGAEFEKASSLKYQRAGHSAVLLPTGKVLVFGGGTQSEQVPEEFYDPLSQSSTDAGFRLKARGSGLAFPGGKLLFAGPNTVERYDSLTKHLEGVDIEYEPGCEHPRIERLASGRALVIGKDAVALVNPSSGRVEQEIRVRLETCDLCYSLTAAGNLILTDAQNGLELVDLGLPNTDRESILASAYFSEPAAKGAVCLPGETATTLLPDSSYLMIYQPSDGSGSIGRMFQPDSELYQQFDFSSPIPRVRMNQQLSISNVSGPGSDLFSLTWPEGSSGTTNASPGNFPVAVWFPATGGPPSLGAFHDWNAVGATWRVPTTAYPGFGFLLYAVNGERHLLGPVEIVPSNIGAPCTSNGECESGYCTDGVCCEEACDGACQACSAAEKGGGSDGECGAAEDGSLDDRCGGELCWGGECSGACDGDHTLYSSDGPLDCSPYRCSVDKHACREECSTNRDCAEGFVCSDSSSGRCEVPPPEARLSSACALGPRDRGSRHVGPGLLLMLVLCARHRRRNVASRVRNA